MRLIDPTAQKARKAAIIWTAASRRPDKPHDGPIFLGATFFFSIPASWPDEKKAAARRGLVLPSGPPDIDNCIKLVMDALKKSGHWFTDDCRVVGLRPGPLKLYADKPGSLIQVQALQGI